MTGVCVWGGGGVVCLLLYFVPCYGLVHLTSSVLCFLFFPSLFPMSLSLIRFDWSPISLCLCRKHPTSLDSPKSSKALSFFSPSSRQSYRRLISLCLYLLSWYVCLPLAVSLSNTINYQLSYHCLMDYLISQSHHNSFLPLSSYLLL